MSSGGAEYYGVVKAVGTGLGFQSLLRDLGLEIPLRAWTDSTASIGICGRFGLGKLRHLDTQCLWLQHKVRSGSVGLRKVKGAENPAHLFTKHLTSAPCVEALLKLFGCAYREGRPEGAPELREGTGTQAGEQLLVADAPHELLAERCWAAGRAEDTAVAELMSVDGRDFPKVLYEGMEVPEAWSYNQTKLPHLQPDLEELFPKAVAAPDAGDRDPPSRDLLGERWADEVDAELEAACRFWPRGSSPSSSARGGSADRRKLQGSERFRT